MLRLGNCTPPLVTFDISTLRLIIRELREGPGLKFSDLTSAGMVLSSFVTIVTMTIVSMLLAWNHTKLGVSHDTPGWSRTPLVTLSDRAVFELTVWFAKNIFEFICLLSSIKPIDTLPFCICIARYFASMCFGHSTPDTSAI